MGILLVALFLEMAVGLLLALAFCLYSLGHPTACVNQVDPVCDPRGQAVLVVHSLRFIPVAVGQHVCCYLGHLSGRLLFVPGVPPRTGFSSAPGTVRCPRHPA